jgi:hypothetical protein
MHSGMFVFSQLVRFLPKETFDWTVTKYKGDKYVKFFTCWNHLLVMMYGQLSSFDSLRELVDVVSAHSDKSYNLGFGKTEIKLANLAKANGIRDYHIFEDFAFKMIEMAQKKRTNLSFPINGHFYAVDSTTIDLCLRDFWWAFFRKTKSGIKTHVVFDVATHIPVYFNITTASVHDMNFMDEIPYKPHAYYVFDKGYFDLERLYKINLVDSKFIIRQRGHLSN